MRGLAADAVKKLLMNEVILLLSLVDTQLKHHLVWEIRNSWEEIINDEVSTANGLKKGCP